MSRTRRIPAAKVVARKFPVGTRVTADHPSNVGQFPIGTVVRLVPGLDAQGGYIVVEWPNGQRGRHTAIALRVVTDA
jgi:hypothetical protein